MTCPSPSNPLHLPPKPSLCDVMRLGLQDLGQDADLPIRAVVADILPLPWSTQDARNQGGGELVFAGLSQILQEAIRSGGCSHCRLEC